jgi:hypothetical protein
MEDTDLKTRRSAVQQLVDAARPKHEPEVQAAMDAYDEARARSRAAPMLEIRFREGSIRTFDYAQLAETEFVDEGRFILFFGRKQIVVAGKNLRRTHTTISERRLRSICEGTQEDESLKPEDAPHIDSINRGARAGRQDIERTDRRTARRGFPA